MNKPAIRIAVLHFAHQTVSFLKNDTALADFVFRAHRQAARRG